MSIDLDIYRGIDANGAACAIDVQATILFSPREGYNADKIAALEHDLGPFIAARLTDALKKGGAA